uniref:glycogenin glucosyltransferase n=1 Tax=Wuchereria bancrofti TaxID=6293 RepID=A0A1I8EW40_WUCBA
MNLLKKKKTKTKIDFDLDNPFKNKESKIRYFLLCVIHQLTNETVGKFSKFHYIYVKREIEMNALIIKSMKRSINYYFKLEFIISLLALNFILYVDNTVICKLIIKYGIFTICTPYMHVAGRMTEAWVTLATSDGYAIGALVLAHSLKIQKTTKKLHCMITTGVSQQLRDELAATFDSINLVNILDSNDTANLHLIGRPDLGVTFTKIHCWRLTQYTKCIFLDADCLVIQNADELFDHDELSAVADIGWPDCFNSGVFVYKPSEQTYLDILNFALEHGSFDGGDQGLLNQFFKGWRDKPPAFRLPFIYNMTSGAIYTYAAAFKKYGAQVKIVHFLGPVKPWQQSSDSVHYSEHLDYWWSLFKSRLTSNLIPGVSFDQSSPPTDEERMRAWEVGHPDYLGADAYNNIQKAIDHALK